MLVTILVIILILALLGGVAPWGPYPTGHFYGGGPYIGGGLGLILIVLLIVLLLGGRF